MERLCTSLFNIIVKSSNPYLDEVKIKGRHDIQRNDSKQTDTRGQCYKTFYHGNLLPFHGNTIILCYKAILPW